jgi:ribosomal protein S19E (S16A)
MPSSASSRALTKFGFEIAMDDFGTILIQLVALGLIDKSDQKRSVTDTGTYWTSPSTAERKSCS